jgi:hypothetical protein
VFFQAKNWLSAEVVLKIDVLAPIVRDNPAIGADNADQTDDAPQPVQELTVMAGLPVNPMPKA